MSDKHETCQECGMTVGNGEYHPFAACLMFKQTHDSRVVRANLTAVGEYYKPTIPPEVVPPMSDLPQGLPDLPPVPDGYDRWEYRGDGWESNETQCAWCTMGARGWAVKSLGTGAFGLPGHFYIEAVKAAPADDAGGMNGWWSMIEPPTKAGVYVLGSSVNGCVGQGRYMPKKKEIKLHAGSFPDITHWQPLPPPPSALIAADRRGK